MKKYKREKRKNMKLKIIAIAVLMVSLLVAFPKVQAYDWSKTSINSGYAVTTDWHGTMVPLETTVTARAGTTDLSIETVWFRWMRPDETEAWPPIEVTTYTLDTWNGKTVRVFINAQEPDEVGDWAVQVVFENSDGHGQGPLPEVSDKVAIRARSFFAIPEVSFGTIAILIAMFGALSAFAIKKKRIP